jgi:dipeptidyl aminopeptidase/acylaminoacyl peptidase
MPRMIAALVLAWGAVLSSRAAPLTAEELFRSAPLGEARLSPDGRHLGAIVTDEHDLKNLLIFDVADYKPVGLRGSGSFDISTFHWLGDDRVVFNVSREKLYTWGLFVADIAHLASFSPINRYDATQIIGIPVRRPGHAIVWITQSSADFGKPGELLELDAGRNSWAYEGARPDSVVRAYPPPPKAGPVMAWAPTREGDVGLCMTWLGGSIHMFQRVPASDGWRAFTLPPGASWMALDEDGRFLWVVTHAPGTGFALRRMEIGSGRMEDPVLTDPSYDMSYGRLYFSEAAHALAGISYLQRKAVSVWFSHPYAVAQATINHNRPDTDNVLVGCDRAERKFLYILAGPQHPGSFELLDLGAATLNVLADSAPWLKGRPLCAVEPIGFTARDGTRLEGYLALPPGASKDHPVPLVVLCHGGPWVRDVPEYNPEVQFLASRGYAVLQPNYRGSTGYSPAISRDGAYDYKGMLDDVVDATRRVIATGIVDPRKVAIMGASFGGYLAVSGVTFEDNLYCCAITECGVFDWERFIKSKSDVARPAEYEFLRDKIGRPDSDRAYLEQISPLEHADRIHVPVLIAHGTEDTIVDVAQSRRLAAELKRRGVPHETFYRAVEGHGFYNYRNRVEFYHRVEAFLAANLGGATLTPPR